MTDFKFGDLYEDRRTHRSGKVVEYNEKYKTYLVTSSDGKSFNVTSSQFKTYWRKIEQEDVQEVIEPIAEPVEVKEKSTYKGTSEEEKKELHDLFASSVLFINDYVKTFQNSSITLKISQPECKNVVRLKVDKKVILDIQVIVKQKKVRLWQSEEDFNKSTWSIEPLAQKKYPYDGRSFTTEFNLEDLPTVLEDLRQVVIDRLAEIKGGLENYAI